MAAWIKKGEKTVVIITRNLIKKIIMKDSHTINMAKATKTTKAIRVLITVNETDPQEDSIVSSEENWSATKTTNSRILSRNSKPIKIHQKS